MLTELEYKNAMLSIGDIDKLLVNTLAWEFLARDKFRGAVYCALDRCLDADGAYEMIELAFGFLRYERAWFPNDTAGHFWNIIMLNFADAVDGPEFPNGEFPNSQAGNALAVFLIILAAFILALAVFTGIAGSMINPANIQPIDPSGLDLFLATLGL